MTPNTPPTLRDMIALEIPGLVKISPKGTKIAYLVRRTNWNTNCYKNQCFVFSVEEDQTFQITRTGHVLSLAWVTEDTLAVLKSKGEEKPQIFLFEHLAGEGVQVTDHKTGVQQFWPFREGVVFMASDPAREENKPRKGQFGSFTRFEQEESPSALYYTSFPALRDYENKSRACTEDEAGKITKPVIQLTQLFETPYAIENVVPSPKGDALYLNCREKDDLVYYKQHGTEDHRVPVSNATELYRGLKEMGVPVELFLYPGFGHPITKPRENHAVMHQNLTWFSHYLLGEELDLMGEKLTPKKADQTPQ